MGNCPAKERNEKRRKAYEALLKQERELLRQENVLRRKAGLPPLPEPASAAASGTMAGAASNGLLSAVGGDQATNADSEENSSSSTF